MGEKWPIQFCRQHVTSTVLGPFTCRKSTTWDRQLYFPSEGRHAEDFFAPKIRWLQPGLLCAVTELNSMDVRSLCSCTVRGHMSSSVVCVCLEFLSWWSLVMESVLKFYGHTATYRYSDMTLCPDFTRTGTPGICTQLTIMTYGRILYKSIMNIRPWN
jgi:hypothetical protein